MPYSDALPPTHAALSPFQKKHPKQVGRHSNNCRRTYVILISRPYSVHQSFSPSYLGVPEDGDLIRVTLANALYYTNQYYLSFGPSAVTIQRSARYYLLHGKCAHTHQGLRRVYVGQAHDTIVPIYAKAS